MALPTIAAVNTAVDNLFAALAERKTDINMHRAVASLNRTFDSVKRAFFPDVALTVTDSADATLAAFIGAGGSLGVALNRAAVVGDVFEVNGTGDTLDNALAAAKGSAVAATDLFQVTNTGTPAVAYLGQASSFDFSGETLTGWRS